MRHIEIAPTFEDWQAVARTLLRDAVPPEAVTWRESTAPPGSLFSAGAQSVEAAAGAPPIIRVPKAFVDLARQVATHGNPERWRLLYEALWRIVHERRDLIADDADPLVERLRLMARETRASRPPSGPARRLSAVASTSASDEDGPPVPGAGAFIPVGANLAELSTASTRCEGCDLYRHARQTVFGRGPSDARVVLVGEQPGDQEDQQGAPFVGPAGEVLDRALVEVGISRESLYVTNVVKHFKFVERGKRRVHQTPRMSEISACRPWLEAELAVIRPEALVCLGATAARALLGPDFRLMKEHGRWVDSRWARKTMATLHPSAVLRGEDEAAQARLYAMLVEDLRLVARG
jgi:uracil-DNA glycosylase